MFWGRNVFIMYISFCFSEEVVVSQKHLYIIMNMLFTVDWHRAVILLLSLTTVHYLPFSQHPIIELLLIGRHENYLGDYLHLLNIIE
jgi:ABC-type cobalamin transport system permease subunit